MRIRVSLPISPEGPIGSWPKDFRIEDVPVEADEPIGVAHEDGDVIEAVHEHAGILVDKS